MMKKLTELYDDLKNKKSVRESDEEFLAQDKEDVLSALEIIEDQIKEISKAMIHDPDKRSKFMQALQHYRQAMDIIESVYV